jgi:hypothetical protein
MADKKKIPEMTDGQVLELAKQRRERHKAETLFKSASDARKRYDWEWLTRDLFRRGYHFSRYNANNRTVVLQTRSVARIPINITAAQMRTIKNQITSVRPKWEVMPIGLSDEAKKNARYSGKTLDYYYDHLNLRRLIKETVIQGLMYSVGGPWQIGYDPDGGEHGEGDVFIWLVDPFDFYIDPSASSLNDAQYVVKAVRTSLNSIRANPDYHFEVSPFDLKGDSRMAASEYKQFLLQALKYYQPRSTEDEDDGLILKEAWIKVHVMEENMDELKEELQKHDQDADDLRRGEVLMRYIVYIDSQETPLHYKLLRRDEFPFSMFQADVNPMEVYGESWIKHVIPMNRALNALESSIFRYNYKYAIGRIVIDKNSGVRIFSNEHGDIVEKNAGSEVTSMPLQPLPASYDRQIQNMRMYIEDVGGAHEVSMGRVPSGVKSGIGIAELKAADAVNQQDLIDGLEEFLVDVGKKLLREIAENFDVPKMIKVLGKSGDPQHFTVVGEAGAKSRRNKKEVRIGLDTFDLAVIGADNEVRVTVGSWLAYTKGARMELLKEWHNAGIIDQQTFLEQAEFADTDEIIRRTRREQIIEKFATQPSASDPNVTDAGIAEQENYMMVEEKRLDVVPLPEDNHQVHLAIHQEALGTDGDYIVEEHMRIHEEFIQQGVESPARPEAQLQPPAMPTGLAPQPAMPPGMNPAMMAGIGGGGMPPGMGQPGMPPGMGQPPGMPMPQGGMQPGSPEEAALIQSLMELTGGGGMM